MSPIIIKVPNRKDTILATRSATDTTVVAHGRNMRAVLSKATKAGAKAPMLVFVPRQDVRYVF